MYSSISKANQDLEEKKAKLIEERLDEIKATIKNFALKEKYDLILDYQAVLYGPDGADITDKITEYLNANKTK